MQHVEHVRPDILLFPFLIAYLSQAISSGARRRDFSTGTPSGTGASYEPPVFMQARR